MRARGVIVRNAAVVLPWVAFVAATEWWRPWGDGIRLQYATDIRDYEVIARAAPGFPSVRIQSPHADRFVPPWVVGELSRLSGIGLHTVYRIVTLLVLAALVGVVAASLRRLAAGTIARSLCLGAVVASAYPLRYLLDAPGMLTDALFALGLALAVHGFVAERYRWLLAGLAVATLGRQTGLPLAVVGAALAPTVRAWRPHRLLYASAAVVVPLVVYVVPHEASASWADTSGRGIVGMSLLGGSWTVREFASHVGRCLIVLVLPAALLALGWLRTRALPPLAPLVLGLTVLAQALALAPDWSHAEPRLAGLAVPALAVAAAPGLERAALGPLAAAAVALGIALASFHHLYSDVGVRGASEWGLLTATGAVLALSPAVRLALGRRVARQTPD